MFWEEFLTQGHLDLERALLLYDRHDQGFAAYCCQQALEKYLKAYLIKHQILRSQPHELGHMSMSRLLTDIRGATDNVLIRFGRMNNRFQLSSSAARTKLKLLDSVLSVLQSNSVKDNKNINPKQEFWSYSMGLPVSSYFERILLSAKNSVTECANPVANELLLYYEIELRPIMKRYSNESKQRAIQKYVSDHGHYNEALAKVIEGEVPSLDKLEVIQFTIAILEYLQHLLTYEIKKEPDLGEFFKLSKEVFMLTYPFKFMDLILKTYPHEDIGRYPRIIHGKSSLQLYQERESALMGLIKEVKAAEEKIENAIFKRWGQA